MELVERSWRAPFTTGLQATIRWFGGWSLLCLLLTLVGLLTWWTWDQARQLPLPPQAHHISRELQGALLAQTTFITRSSPVEVRGFYRQALPQRGWQYCGTQATPGCTNLVSGATGTLTDVYRRPDDRDHRGPSIEVWPIINGRGETYVVIWEANRYARPWE